jgi:hypothetical protein
MNDVLHTGEVTLRRKKPEIVIEDMADTIAVRG